MQHDGCFVIARVIAKPTKYSQSAAKITSPNCFKDKNTDSLSFDGFLQLVFEMTPSHRLKLPDVTLCAIDTRTPDLALRSLILSMAGIEFAQAILFTSKHHALKNIPLGLQIVLIPELQSIQDYSLFILSELGQHIQSTHALVSQWDGYVTNPSAWRPEFLEFDYIGAPWPNASNEQSVGNGGFSLRSKRLLQATASPEFQISHPEDLSICQHNRSLLIQAGLRFAPPEMALQFSQERVTASCKSFGFHGAFHLMRFTHPEELAQLVHQLPPHMTRSLDIKELAKRLLQSKEAPHLDIARTLIKKRFLAGLRDIHQWKLWLRLQWAQWRDYSRP